MLTHDKDLLFIGEVSTKSEIPIETIRYYENLGLLKPLTRTKGGYRQFSSLIVARLSFIKRAQLSGLNLHEIKEMLDTIDRKSPPSDSFKRKLEAHIGAVNCRIEQLRFLQNELSKMLLHQ